MKAIKLREEDWEALDKIIEEEEMLKRTDPEKYRQHREAADRVRNALQRMKEARNKPEC